MSADNGSPWRTPSATPSQEHQPPKKRVKLDPGFDNISPDDEVQTPSMVFSADQQAAVDLILSGSNVFLTGCAGSGKTAVLKAAIRQLLNRNKRVTVIAPTGRAAEHVGGVTLSHFAGWDPFTSKWALEDIMSKARRKTASKRFKDLDILILDEVSMVSSYTLERLNHALRAGRADRDEGNNSEHDSVVDDDEEEEEDRQPREETLHEEPFGGAQLVCCGDFCQLPPVSPFDNCIQCGKGMKSKRVRNVRYYSCEPCAIEEKEDKKWAFHATVWADANFKKVFLSKNQRQSDGTLVPMLEKIARGEKLARVSKLLLLNHPEDTKGAIKLFPKNEQVDEENKKELDQHEGQSISFKSQNYFWRNKQHKWLMDREIPIGKTISPKMMQERHSYADCLELKLGMPVILLRNLDVKRGLVNGSRGRIIGFDDTMSRGEVAKLSCVIFGGDEASKSENVGGRGGEFVELYQDQVKEFMAINSDEEDLDKPLQWPRVLFDNGLEVIVLPDCRMALYGNEEPYSKEVRTQIPLAAGWAMTIHKSQGLTLDKVIVHLTDVFQAEQVYVALSRAKTFRGLKVIGTLNDFDKHKSDPAVLRFLKKTKWNIGDYAR